MNNKKILIAEDDGLLSFYLEKKLRLMKYETIFIVSSGEEAIFCAEREMPDLLLMDVQLRGGIDGIEAAKKIKSKLNVPVVFLTAFTDEKTVSRAKNVAPHGYLVKPILGRELELTIELVFYKYELETRLMESELKYRTLVMTARDAVLTLDETGHITSCNDSALILTRNTEFDLIGSPLDVVLPNIFENLIFGKSSDYSGELTTSGIEAIEVEALHHDGTLFPVELSFSCWRLQGQSCYTLIFRDITKRREIEKALQRAYDDLEERIRQRNSEIGVLINNSPLPVCVFNPEGALMFANDPARQKLVFTRKQETGADYNIFMDPLFGKLGYAEKLRNIFSRGGLLVTQPIFFDPADMLIEDMEGSLLVFHFIAVTNDLGKVYSVLSVLEDITEREKAEESSRALAEEKDRTGDILNRIDEERKRISSELHDGIGQLLSAIKFNIELAERQEFKDPTLITKAKDQLVMAGKEIKNIILSVYPVILENAGLLPAIEELCTEIEQNSHLQINRFLEETGNRFPLKTELSMYRIIQESLNNIIKHAKASKVDIMLKRQHGIVAISVTDNGIGFNTESMTFRGNLKSLGLIRMKERVGLLNGSFYIDSEIGKGATIHIEVPIEEN